MVALANKSEMAAFEDIVNQIAFRTAVQTISRGLGSLMVFPSLDTPSGRPAISVLNMTWYITPFVLHRLTEQ